MKRIVYTRPNGGVSVACPSPKFLAKFGSEEEGLAAFMAKAVPTQATDAEVIDVSEFPADHTCFDAWMKVGRRIEVDMDKARAIDAERMERARRARVRDLLEREVLGEDVAAEMAELRAMRPAEVLKGAKTPDDLKVLWPVGLARSG